VTDPKKNLYYWNGRTATEINKFSRKGKELLSILFNGKLNNLEASLNNANFFVDVVLLYGGFCAVKKLFLYSLMITIICQKPMRLELALQNPNGFQNIFSISISLQEACRIENGTLYNVGFL
jgi:hypothetical protein